MMYGCVLVLWIAAVGFFYDCSQHHMNDDYCVGAVSVLLAPMGIAVVTISAMAARKSSK